MQNSLKLFLLTSLTMCAFAANSVFNRLSLAEGEIGPSGFALIRTFSGAAILLLLVVLQSNKGASSSRTNISVKHLSLSKLSLINIAPMLALSVYILGFSYAYVTLDAGLGALILFGGVQITMFLGALYKREAISTQRWVGSLLAFCGMVWLFAPADDQLPILQALLMGTAAVGWGIYSLLGRKVTNPLRQTQRSFCFALPLVFLVYLVVPDKVELTQRGVMFAVLSGALTSGLGYALWYAILPKLETITASVAQLTVPIIALIGGMLLLNEPLTLRFAISAVLIMLGVIIAVKK
jgi:drug/metabolite transporter (DMT)-like permease